MGTVLITGASRGIGLEFARQYAAEGNRVLATCRAPEKAAELGALEGEVSVHRLDVTALPGIEALARALHGEAIDILINNAGMLTSGQRAGGIDFTAWVEELKVNTIGPIAVAHAFLPHLRRGTGRRMAFLSSTLASIGENTSGAYVLYRSSKAGLNAAVRSLAIDSGADGMIVLLLHPGWVRTDIGGPSAPVAAKDSVRGMRRVIAAAGPEDSGRFLGFDGREIPW
jgi:NAD(P)-dependent dehydrogenase (short-subunit alcohol dehydrogenase family)